MKKELETVHIGWAYPTGGIGWRCFDGERWHDCDRYGNIIKRGDGE